MFFSRITLEDKLGKAFEPCIFAALNSSKAMIVLGTKPEYFNAVWVKNEWSRYLSLIRKGAKKVLIPAYKDVDPYDLPEEFSHLQAQDMSKLGFMQDLIRGVKKITSVSCPVNSGSVTGTDNIINPNTTSIIKRAYIFLEDSAWDKAFEYCEKALDLDPENDEAYVGLLLANLKIKTVDGLSDSSVTFGHNDYFKKAYRYSNAENKRKLQDLVYENNYRIAVSKYKNAGSEIEFKKAWSIFKSIPGYRDSDALAQDCQQKAQASREESLQKAQASKMEEIYMVGISHYKMNTIEGYKSAIVNFQMIIDYKDSKDMINISNESIEKITAKNIAIKKKRKIIILACFAIGIASFISLNVLTAPSRSIRAERISNQLIGITMWDWEEIKSNDYYEIRETSFKFEEDRKVEYTYEYTKKVTKTYTYYDHGHRDTSDITKYITDYYVEVPIFGDPRVIIEGKDYALTVNKDDKPISMHRGDVDYQDR